MKNIVITGASDGIGREAARQLSSLGHKVVIVGRTPAKVQAVAEELGAPYHIADFAKLSDVVRLAKELETYPQIDVLANNAGAIMKEHTVTQDGFESTFQVNVLSPFLLTTLLVDKLCQNNATVVQTSSIAAKYFGRKIDICDIANPKHFAPTKVYGESKLCNILFTQQLHRRYGDKGICAVAFQPGISRTNFAAEGPAFYKFAFHSPLKYLFTLSQKRSAKRLVRLALGEQGKDFVCGETYGNKRIFDAKFDDSEKAGEQLWELCRTLTAPFLKIDADGEIHEV